MKLKLLSTLKLSKVLFFAGLLFSSFVTIAQTTVTKSYNAPSSVSVDGCGTYCTNLPDVTFTTLDFPNGCQITDVNVNIVWAKTDGTCSAPGTGNSFHNETNFRLDSPLTNAILVAPGVYTGTATISAVSTTFDQSAATVVGGANPVSGTFQPNSGNLDVFNGTSALGNWAVRAGDTGSGDPLCISSYSVTITVADDVTPPNISSCPGNQVGYVDANCIWQLPDYTGLVVATDECSTPVLTQTPAAGTILSSGITPVTITAVDGFSNSSTCSFNVWVSDTIYPTMICPGNQMESANTNCEFVIPDYTGQTMADDNCGAPIVVQTPAPGTVVGIGTTPVSITVTDADTNWVTCAFDVIVEDLTAPTPDSTSLVDMIECNSAMPMVPTATDNCGGSITGTPDVALPVTTPGLTVVTWTFDDGNGNISTQSQNITVNTVDASVTQNGSTLTANATAGSFQWLDCDNNYQIIAGETNASYIPMAINGNYAVEVTNNGCVDTSACYNVDYTGVKELANGIVVSIYPNPSTGKFEVNLSGADSKGYVMTISDLSGRQIIGQDLGTINDEGSFSVDISDKPAGAYLLNIDSNGQNVYSTRIVKE